MNDNLTSLAPSAIWRHFQTLCNIPRPSCHEAALRTHLIDWATELGLETYVDPVGNLLIRKAATKGMEDRETVVLQGHLDMVAQKNADSDHDFTKDPIVTQIIDGWVHATGTTLGADNGIGVAAALAVLESTDLAHGPIEALFTIEEETSLKGALQLEEDLLRGKILLNLDSEDRGDVYIGCAGGMDISVAKSYASVAPADDCIGLQICVSGLRGGHSGLDIQKGRASANVLIVRLLNVLKEEYDFGLSALSGGTLRNAISRDASVMINIKSVDYQGIVAFVEAFAKATQAEFATTEPHLNIQLSPTESDTQLAEQDAKALLSALFCAPHGVHRMSAELDGVTETSCNLGVINLSNTDEGGKLFDARLLVRSLVDSAVAYHSLMAKSAFSLIEAQVTLENGYPGWRPDPNAGLLKHFLAVHKDITGYAANVKVIHAGLECGIIGAKYPGMEMVSFGPNIRGAHSPAERMEIDSVGDFWNLLVALLASTPQR
ncbi:aminoacyl-histidine dipeptidase [Marinomonas sp. A79]|uniref:Aminoacyl-histidine dipeptidase n=1 Tax=Marinomonas vulgaris TaxID=2823372 RepID=A0ABS5H8J4_9GAMM|nr:aminoacyl-histidine dipeptidase [Marinomonas vulgaris]MBR7888012.1 aminoacyl-histidine dipeptidase [Marinomonas vulgaris]